MTDNIIKHACKELGITQAELAKRIGMSADSLNTALSKNKISKTAEAATMLLLEVGRLEKELEQYKTLKEALREAVKP